MKSKCPNCGATNSLDSLLANEGAREAILACANLSGELGIVTVRYVGLFRPEKTELTYNRVAKLINELLPHIQGGRLQFDSKLFDAPIDAWIYAMNEMLKLRELGKLELPMPNHNYLFRIVSSYRAPVDTVATMPSNNTGEIKPSSQMEAGVVALNNMKRGG